MTELASWNRIDRIGLLLMESLVVATAILAIASVGAHLCRRQSAAVRHRLWAVAVGVLLLVPICLAVLPRFGPPIALDASSVGAGVTTSDRSRIADPSSKRDAPRGRDARNQRDREPRPPSELANATPRRAGADDHASLPTADLTIDHVATSEAATSQSIGLHELHSVAVGVWLVGVVIGLCGLFGAHWAVISIANRSVPVSDPYLLGIRDSLAADARLPLKLPLVCSAAVDVPLTICWYRPMIVLPPGYGTWDEQRQRIVLAHEMAHIQRRDVLWQFVAHLVRAVYWCHPLVWLANWRMQVERELACDDFLLDQGVPAREYAFQLIDAAAEMMSAKSPPACAVAIVGRSNLENRVRAMLDHKRPRRPIGRRTTGLLLAVALGSVVLSSLSAPAYNVVAMEQVQGGTPAEIGDAESGYEAQPQQPQSVEAAAKLLLTAAPEVDWTLHEVDQQPSVDVAGHRGYHVELRHRGYRVVLRRRWKDYEMANQQQATVAARLEAEPHVPFEWRHEDWEFVLFPIHPLKPPADLTSKIAWQKSNSRYHSRDVYMGEGWGYMWFTRGTIFGQEHVREQLKLRGGDDRIQLAIDGILVVDEGTVTGNSCLHIPGKFGDKALPYVQRAINQTNERDALLRVVGCLRYIRTPKSADLLLKLYDFGHDDIRRAAEYALIHEPYREAAKRAYFDMLRRRSSVNHACKACVQHNWTDAVPILRDLVAKPRNLREFEYAIHARRTLEGNPIDQQLLDAEQTLRKLMQRERDAQLEAEITEARQLLIQSQDAEAANLAALSLATATNKGDTALVNLVGLEILQSRPRPSTVAFLRSLVEGTKDAEQPLGEGLLHAVESAP